MSNNGRTKRILILGGGFAGLYAAMELEKTLGGNPGIEVTLVFLAVRKNSERCTIYATFLISRNSVFVTAIRWALRRR